MHASLRACVCVCVCVNSKNVLPAWRKEDPLSPEADLIFTQSQARASRLLADPYPKALH
jgi:hypothetical protein